MLPAFVDGGTHDRILSERNPARDPLALPLRRD
jgi:hypothetical protein